MSRVRDYSPQDSSVTNRVIEGMNKNHENVRELVNVLLGQLKEARNASGLSQRKLATLAGLDPKTISFFEQRKRSPTLHSLLLIAEVLEFDLGKSIGELRNEN